MTIFNAVRGRLAPAGRYLLPCSLAALVVLCQLGNAFAQVPNLNSDVFNTPRQMDNMKSPDELIPKPEDEEDPEIETGEQQEQKESSEEGPKVVLQELIITGVTVFTSEELTEKFAPWIGKEVSFNDLLKVAGEITKLYKDNGYATSRAIVPPQKVDNGSIHIIVQEGKVGKILLEGNKFTRDKFVLGRVDVKEGDIFRLQNLEKDMVRLNDQGVIDQAHATLIRGEAAGTSDVKLNIKDHRPYHLQLGVDNQGRDAVGLYRTSISGNHENLLGMGDSLSAGVTLASRTTAVSTQYRYPLNRDGDWGLTGSYIYSKVRVRDPLIPTTPDEFNQPRDPLEIKGKTHRFGLVTDFPLFETDDGRWKLSGDAGMYWTDSMVYLNGLSIKEYQVPPEDQFHPIVRTIVTGLNVTEQDKTGRTVGRASMTNGVAWMGGNIAFSKWNLEATRIQGGLPFGMMLIGRGQIQLSSGRLPGIEQMQLGGSSSVRGFTEGILIGDVGYFVGSELRFPMYGLPDKIKKNWQGLVFVDHGGVYIGGHDAAEDASGTPGYLTSYGVGVRGSITKYLQAQSDLGFVWQQDMPSMRAHFRLTSQLF